MPPYIGVTDVPNSAWLLNRCRVFDEACDGQLEHVLHAGVMMSYRSLHGLPTRYDHIWPKNEEIGAIFVPRPKLLCVLHYADYEGKTTIVDLARAYEYGRPWIRGLQLDMPWPDGGLLWQFRELYPDARVILQVGRRAFNEIGHDVRELVVRLRLYKGLLNDVLLDMIGGRGEPMNAEDLRPLVGALQNRHPDLGVTVAGGLGPDTLHLVEPLICDFPGISVDAQGQLRPSGKSTDPIDTDRVDAYLQGTSRMFRAARARHA